MPKGCEILKRGCAAVTQSNRGGRREGAEHAQTSEPHPHRTSNTPSPFASPESGPCERPSWGKAPVALKAHFR